MARATRASPLFSGTVLFSFNHAITTMRTSDRRTLGRKHDLVPEKSSLVLRSTAAFRNPSHRAISALEFVVHHLKTSHLLLACAVPTQSIVSSRTTKIVRTLLDNMVSPESEYLLVILAHEPGRNLYWRLLARQGQLRWIGY